MGNYDRNYYGITGELNGQWKYYYDDLLSNIVTGGFQYFSTHDHQSLYKGQNVRDGARIMVDVSDALTSPDKGDVVLQQGDTVVIPFSQFTVTVTGSVNSPGSYAYMPDRGAEYYINLAKGYSADSARSFKIVDRDGKKINTDVVPADSTIIVNRNNLTANLAIVASVLSIVSAVLTIIINGHTIATF